MSETLEVHPWLTDNASSGVDLASGLQQANERFLLSLVPCLIYLSALMLIGIPGNSLVIFVFGCRLKHSAQNLFIVFLAVFDLLSCAVAMPGEIVDIVWQFKYRLAALCKVMRFINAFTTISSIFVLVIIAVDRFRLVRTPMTALKAPITSFHARLSLVPVLLLSALFSCPAVYVYGLRTVDSGVPGVKGLDCTISDEAKTTLVPLVYNGVLFICFIVLTASLVVMYSLILRGVRKHARTQRKASVGTLSTENDRSLNVSSSRKNSISTLLAGESGELSNHEPICSENTHNNEFTSNSTNCNHKSLMQINNCNSNRNFPGKEQSSETDKSHEKDKSQETDTINDTDKPLGHDPSDNSGLERLDIQEGVSCGPCQVKGRCSAQTFDVDDGQNKVATTLCLDYATYLPKENNETPHALFEAEEQQHILKQQLAMDSIAQSESIISSETPEDDTNLDHSQHAGQENQDTAHIIKPEEHQNHSRKGNHHHVTFAVVSAEVNAQDLNLIIPQVLDPSAHIQGNSIFPLVTPSQPLHTEKTQGFFNPMFIPPEASEIHHDTEPDEEHDHEKATNNPNKENSMERRVMAKTTIIAFVVTLVFILSFVPHLGLQVAHLLKKGMDEELRGAPLALYNLFLRSYFINSVANPVIYGVMNDRFRQQVKLIFRRRPTWLH